MTLEAFPPIYQTVSVTLKSTQPTRVSVSHSLKQQSRTTGAQRWALQLTLPPLTKAQFMPYFSFLLAHRGQADPFTIVVPTLTAPQGKWGHSVAVYNPQSVSDPAAADRGRTFNVSGMQGMEPAAKAGDLLKFAGHSKVYMVTADSAVVPGGFAQITIEPALVAAIAHNEAITVRQVPFTVVNVSDNLSASITAGPQYLLTLDLVEVF